MNGQGENTNANANTNTNTITITNSSNQAQAPQNNERQGVAPGELLRGAGNRIVDQQEQMNAELTNFLPHSLLFRRLEGIEKELDLLLKDRHFTFQEYSKMGQTSNVAKKLRISVFNTFDNTEPVYCTSEQERVHRLIEPPHWTLRIEGGLVNDEKEEDYIQGAPKFSNFVKSLYIELDREAYPDNWAIEWNKSQFMGETDGFEFKRVGDTETIVNIFLVLDYHGKFKVVPTLAQELGLSQQAVFSKAHVLHSLWKYIRARNLQDPQNPQKVNCNTNLKQLFKKDCLLYSEMPQLLAQYLVPPGPIQIQHEIQVRGPLMESTYEVPFDLPPPNSLPISKEIEAIDQKVTYFLIRTLKF
uniref:DM2 domain-containing protein n=1 Tax=Arcella intermedia TaxID=1963864 RepID=A0A6B2L843_9EUKA